MSQRLCREVAWEGGVVEMRWMGGNGKWIKGGAGLVTSRKVRFELFYCVGSGSLSTGKVSNQEKGEVFLSIKQAVQPGYAHVDKIAASLPRHSCAKQLGLRETET